MPAIEELKRTVGVIRFKDGKMEKIKMPDAETQCNPRESVCAASIFINASAKTPRIWSGSENGFRAAMSDGSGKLGGTIALEFFGVLSALHFKNDP